MHKLLTVIGATGNQGLSVINAALKGGTYRVRGLTRNPASEKATALASRGVEIVKADINDEQSLIAAFEGSHAVYAITDFFEPFATHGPEQAIEIERTQGINIAKAASKTSTLEHYIWSTLPPSSSLTNGKYEIPHFIAKNKVDDYIRKDESLFAKTTFLWITWYANNYQYPIFTPNFIKSSNSYIQVCPAAGDLPMKTIGSALANVGGFALAILNQPQITLPGKIVCAYTEETTAAKLLQDWAEVTGNRATYVKCALDAYSDIWPDWGMEMGSMMKMWDELREKSWPETGVLNWDDLGIRGERWGSAKDAYQEMDWKAIL